MNSLSLVIPVFEAGPLLGSILGHVAKLKATAAESGFELVETIVVDDGGMPPVDKTAFGAPGDVEFSVLRNDRNRGKGYSVRRGALAAKGAWVLMSDVDESAPLEQFAELAPHSGVAMV